MLKKLRGTRIGKILPSIVTMAALSSGVSAIKAAHEGHYDWSIYLLFFAAIFDGLDGHVARYLHAASEFGAELDSLCDLVDFGVAPALIINIWAEKNLGANLVSDWMLWGASILFCSACSYRLARFNLTDSTTPKPKDIAKVPVEYTSSEDEDETKQSKRRKSKLIKKMNDAMDGYITKKKFFQGVPAPVAGALGLVPLVCALFGLDVSPVVDGRLFVCVNLLLVSALMTSKIPTLSSKMFMRDPRKESHLKSRSLKTLAFKIAFAVFAVYVLYFHPWEVSFVSASLYYVSIPVGVLIYFTIEEAPKQQ